MEIQNRLATRVKAQRREKGWSQEELAYRASVHRSFVSQIERATKVSLIVTVEKVARAFEKLKSAPCWTSKVSWCLDVLGTRGRVRFMVHPEIVDEAVAQILVVIGDLGTQIGEAPILPPEAD